MDQLPAKASRALLRGKSIHGSDSELELLAQAFGFHALALNLVAAYLREIPGHPIQAAYDIEQIDVTVKEERHARRVLSAFIKRYGESPEIQLLSILSLFDRPCESVWLDAICAEPAIPHLTELLRKHFGFGLVNLVGKLQKRGLLSLSNWHEDRTLDCHPIIREHFNDWLKLKWPKAYKIGHRRIYQYLKETSVKKPSNIDEVTPLYLAISHGCSADLYHECLHDIYMTRIQRGPQFFATYNIASFGEDLAALASFFDVVWTKPTSLLPPNDAAFVLKQSAFNLRAQGALSHAVSATKSALEIYLDVGNEDWQEASVASALLNQIFIATGDLKDAIRHGLRGVVLADKSQDTYRKIVNRTAYAHALHYFGNFDEAASVFKTANELDKNWESTENANNPKWDYKEWDLFLDLGKPRLVKELARKSIENQIHKEYSIGRALDYLALARAQIDLLNNGFSGYQQIEEYLDIAVEGLREARSYFHMPHGFLARAALFRIKGETEKAHNELDLLLAITRRYGMRLYRADAYVESALLDLFEGHKEAAKKKLAYAVTMGKEMNYNKILRHINEIRQTLF